jgi:hypothetical protein
MNSRPGRAWPWLGQDLFRPDAEQIIVCEMRWSAGDLPEQNRLQLDRCLGLASDVANGQSMRMKAALPRIPLQFLLPGGSVAFRANPALRRAR